MSTALIDRRGRAPRGSPRCRACMGLAVTVAHESCSPVTEAAATAYQANLAKNQGRADPSAPHLRSDPAVGPAQDDETALGPFDRPHAPASIGGAWGLVLGSGLEGSWAWQRSCSRTVACERIGTGCWSLLNLNLRRTSAGSPAGGRHRSTPSVGRGRVTRCLPCCSCSPSMRSLWPRSQRERHCHGITTVCTGTSPNSPLSSKAKRQT